MGRVRVNWATKTGAVRGLFPVGLRFRWNNSTCAGAGFSLIGTTGRAIPWSPSGKDIPKK